MRPFEIHVFVCTSGKTCPADGQAANIHARLKEMVKSAGLTDRIRINQAGCLDQCGHGPMVVVYPECVWYCGVRLCDVEALFQDHLVGGVPVERLIYRPEHPGANKVPCPKADAPAGRA